MPTYVGMDLSVGAKALSALEHPGGVAVLT
jgi:hypothetical protein